MNIAVLLCVVLVSVVGHSNKRNLKDEQVLESQRPYMQSWRNHFNDADADYCGGAYVEDATVMVRWGPAAPVALKLAGMKHVVVARGRNKIHQLWKAVINQMGLKALKAYEEEGDYAPTTLALDDNTVVVGGKFRFQNGAATGRIYSETWVRAGEAWNLMSAMWVIEDVDMADWDVVPTADTGTKVATPSPTQKKAWFAEGTPAPAPAKSMAEATMGEPSAKPLASKVEDLAQFDEANLTAGSTNFDEDDIVTTPAAQSLAGPLIWTAIFAGTCFVAFYAYRSKSGDTYTRRSYVGGPDMLLG